MPKPAIDNSGGGADGNTGKAGPVKSASTGTDASTGEAAGGGGDVPKKGATAIEQFVQTRNAERAAETLNRASENITMAQENTQLMQRAVADAATRANLAQQLADLTAKNAGTESSAAQTARAAAQSARKASEDVGNRTKELETRQDQLVKRHAQLKDGQKSDIERQLKPNRDRVDQDRKGVIGERYNIERYQRSVSNGIQSLTEKLELETKRNTAPKSL